MKKQILVKGPCCLHPIVKWPCPVCHSQIGFPRMIAVFKCCYCGFEWLSLAAVAHLLSVSKSTTWRWSKQGLLRYRQDTPGGRIYFRKEEILKSLDNLPVIGGVGL